MAENYNYSSIENIDFNSIFSSFKENSSETSNSSINDNNSSNPFGNIDINTMMKMKSIIDKMNNSKNDPRSNLLRSLKPYLSSKKREQVDKYIQIFSIGTAFEGINNFGGDDKSDV